MAEYAGKSVIFKTDEELNSAIQQYEEETVTHFVVAGMNASYSTTEVVVNTVRWQLLSRNGEGVDIPFDNVPFCWVGRKYLVCQYGKRKTDHRKKIEQDKAAGKSSSYKRKNNVETKKLNCPAKITIKKVVKFPEFKFDGKCNLKVGKERIKTRLLNALQDGKEEVVKEVQYYVRFAAIEDHKGHEMGEDAAKREPVDRRVLIKLEELANTGITSGPVLQSLIYKHVELEIFKDRAAPPRSRRRYYPTLKDIQNFMTRWYKKNKMKRHDKMGEASSSVARPLWNDDDDDDVDLEDDEEEEEGDDVEEEDETVQDGLVKVERTVEEQEIHQVEEIGHNAIIQEQICVQTQQEQDALMTLMNTVVLNSVQQQQVAVTSQSDGTCSYTAATQFPVVIAVVEPVRAKKAHRLGLLQKMKAAMHKILDFSLLVEDEGLLERFLADLERMSSEADLNASLDPAEVQKQLAKRRKRSAPPAAVNDDSTRPADPLTSEPSVKMPHL